MMTRSSMTKYHNILWSVRYCLKYYNFIDATTIETCKSKSMFLGIIMADSFKKLNK